MKDWKICRVCGRRFDCRPRWKDCWDAVSTCSKGCRRSGVRAVDRELEAGVLELLAERAPTSSICPSEVARRVRPDDWRSLMERTRRAARRLVHAGRVEITQRGRVIDPSDVRGPIRIRRAASGREFPQEHRMVGDS